MLIVDASVLFEVLADTAEAPGLRQRLRADQEHAAPHLIDAEVLAVIAAQERRETLDATAARQAVEDLRAWPGERWGHRALVDRCWELRHSVRLYDALYVALAEALDAPLLTRDRRLATAHGPRCPIEVI